MGWIKPTVSMIIGASLGYYLGDLLGSYIQVHVWDFIGSFIKYFVVVVAVLLGIYLGWGLTNKNKNIREESITVLGAVVGATVGFYLGRLLGIYLRELAIVYVWDFIGVIIQYSFLILGTVVGAVVGAAVGAGVGAVVVGAFAIMEENRLKNVVPYRIEKRSSTKGSHLAISLDLIALLPSRYKEVLVMIEIFEHDRQSLSTKEVEGDINNSSYFRKVEKVTLPYRAKYFNTYIYMKDLKLIKQKQWNYIEVRYSILEKISKKTISSASQNLYYYPKEQKNTTEDTKDKPTEELLTVEELMIQTAFYMSNIDGNVNEKEGKLITSFGEKLLKKKSSKEDYLRNKEKINGYIKNAQKDVKNNRVNIHNVLAEINKKCTIDEKKFLFETCLYIAKADGAANNSELKFVKSLVKNMCLNKVESKIMIEKILSTDSSQKENEKKIEKSLGISSNMSNEAILEILKQEYKKWNQRVGLSEPAKREKAEMMLHKIAELRQKYKN